MIKALSIVISLIWGLNMGAKPANAQELTILALGDSLTAGYGLPLGQSFASQLEARLIKEGRKVKVINAGVSGDTTAGGLFRLQWALKAKPDAVIIELGANDALRGLSPLAVRENLANIIKGIKESGVKKVLLAGMLAPKNMGPEYAAAFNPIYPELAEEHGVRLYPFFLEGVAGNPALNLGDGIHPTSAGVEVIVEKILPWVLEIL